MLRAILFDFNGVLVDDEPLHQELIRRVLDEECLDVDDELIAGMIGLDDRTCLGRALEAAGEAPDEIRIIRLVARKGSYYQERIHEDGFEFFPGAVELVRDAHARDITLGLVSSALWGEIESALRQAELFEVFKSIVSAEDVAQPKPSPAPYLRALQDLNALPPLPERLFHPHEVLAVEDTPVGITAAAGAGLATLGVAHTHDAGELSSADAVVQTLMAVKMEDLQARLQEATRR
ncbi:MAG: HAD family phosphatase [Acidobacteriota bacterium]|nr:HAD family phosphatase [Acidobacteriota bacterium]